MAAKKNPGSAKSFHFTAALLLLVFSLMQWEGGRNSAFFLVMGLLFLLISLSQSAFFSKPGMEALVLWIESICLLMAGLRSFSSGNRIFPWLFIVIAVVYALKGLTGSGLIKQK